MENYEVCGQIGEGTYGVVLKARHKSTGQLVAIKKFKESDQDEQVRKTALREIRILQQLKHDNIVNLLEVFRYNGKLCLVFEYVQRTILEDLEQNPNGLDPLAVKRCFYQLLSALDFLHSHNIIHRDIKPENLLISKNGVLKLCDFGFARTLGGPSSKYTDYVATRWYRAPELLVGDTNYGPEVDIWAAGCMFAEILNGLPLFPGESDVDQLFKIMKCLGPLTPRFVDIFRKNPLYVGVKLPQINKTESLSKKFPKMDKSVISIMAACLRYEPQDRDTPRRLLLHSYFAGFPQWFNPEHKKSMDRDRLERDSQMIRYMKGRSRRSRDGTRSKRSTTSGSNGSHNEGASSSTHSSSQGHEDEGKGKSRKERRDKKKERTQQANSTNLGDMKYDDHSNATGHDHGADHAPSSFGDKENMHGHHRTGSQGSHVQQYKNAGAQPQKSRRKRGKRHVKDKRASKSHSRGNSREGEVNNQHGSRLESSGYEEAGFAESEMNHDPLNERPPSTASMDVPRVEDAKATAAPELGAAGVGAGGGSMFPQMNRRDIGSHLLAQQKPRHAPKPKFWGGGSRGYPSNAGGTRGGKSGLGPVGLKPTRRVRGGMYAGPYHPPGYGSRSNHPGAAYSNNSGAYKYHFHDPGRPYRTSHGHRKPGSQNLLLHGIGRSNGLYAQRRGGGGGPGGGPLLSSMAPSSRHGVSDRGGGGGNGGNLSSHGYGSRQRGVAGRGVVGGGYYGAHKKKKVKI